MAKKNMSIYLIVGVIALALILTTSLRAPTMSVLTGDRVSRTFEKVKVAPGTQVDITYSPNVANTFVVREDIPTGWTLIDNAGGAVTDGTFRLYSASPFTITLEAPTVAFGTNYDFMGDFSFAGETQYFTFDAPYPQAVTICDPGCYWTGVEYCTLSITNDCDDICSRPSTQNTAGDYDCNGCIDDFEILDALDSWVHQTGIGDLEVLNILGKWVIQEGCPGLP